MFGGGNIVLQSNDGENFQVPLDVAKRSQTIKTMLEDLGEEESEVPIPLPNIRSDTLKRIIDWATYHRDDAPAKNCNIENCNSDAISTWDSNFLNVDQSSLFDIILAANYLDIKDLLEIGCKTVANMIKGKTPEEIRRTFDIKCDFTPEEEEQVRKENEWCEEK